MVPAFNQLKAVKCLILHNVSVCMFVLRFGLIQMFWPRFHTVCQYSNEMKFYTRMRNGTVWRYVRVSM